MIFIRVIFIVILPALAMNIKVFSSNLIRFKVLLHYFHFHYISYIALHLNTFTYLFQFFLMVSIL